MALTAAVISVCAFVAWMVAQPASARAQPREGRRPQVERMSPDEMSQRMEQFRQRMLEQVREQLGFSVEEWQAVQPLYQKVMGLQRQVSPNPMRMGGFGRFGGRRGGPDGQRRGPRPDPFRIPGVENDPVLAQTRQKLEETLDDDKATAESIGKALTAYRLARGEVEKQLATAQQELRSVLSVRQEAILVSSGMLP